ncbi:MAG TPA: N-acetylglucosamine-6-phosphate deacetylase, partial [Panacibacter sp.]|nr:N-acetylglucosamine-6-phosphate deacetylase [Panacibacter sp.]
IQCMPTVATNTYKTIFQCIDAIKRYWQQGGKGALGLHVEGPWINAAKRGAHREEWIFSPTVEQAKELLEYGKDVIKIITIAPECCSQEVIDLIHSYGIVVSAGHTNATYRQATDAFDKGIHTATHLYNAMSGLQHRAPGMVGAIFNHNKVCCSIVPDGHHVDFAAIKIAKKIMGERLFAITDAVTETKEGYYKHTLETDKYTSNGILSGSALTMHKCFLNFVQHCDIEIEEALRMCSLYPAMVLNMQQQFGAIKQNYKAEMVVINNDLELEQVIVS